MPSLPDTPTVLVTAAGSNVAYGIARALRDRYSEGLRLIGADINPARLVGSASLTDLHVEVPLSADREFGDVVADMCHRLNVDLYIPILDPEIPLAARLAAESRLPSRTRVLAPQASVADLCHDKLALSRWLAEQGLTSPRTVDADDHSWEGRPVFVKPRRGHGSRGVGLARSLDEYRVLRGQPEPLVIQEPCSSPEVTIDVFWSPRGDRHGWRAVCRERLEVRQGVCTKARVFEDECLEGVARGVCEGLGLTGLACIQVMRLDDRWAIVDVNPRMGAGTPLSVAAGVDVISAAVADALELDAVSLPRLRGERYVVRVYREIVN